MDDHAQKLHALLYVNGGEMKRSDVQKKLGIDETALTNTVSSLAQFLEPSGLRVFTTQTTLSLRTAPEHSDFIQSVQDSETQGDIGTAGLEVLAIVLYKEGASRTDIDYIRGVNSSATLRQLVARGLLERTRDARDARAWMYTATPELLAHLGVTHHSALPDFEALTAILSQRGEQTVPDETSVH